MGDLFRIFLFLHHPEIFLQRTDTFSYSCSSLLLKGFVLVVLFFMIQKWIQSLLRSFDPSSKKKKTPKTSFFGKKKKLEIYTYRCSVLRVFSAQSAQSVQSVQCSE